MKSDAFIHGPYRYWLTRHWKAGDDLLWVMLNPSTADATEDDPTIKRCISFSQKFGYGSMTVLNLFAWRATDPEDLMRSMIKGEDIVGPKNPVLMANALAGHETVVCAWGAWADKFLVGSRMTRLAEDVQDIIVNSSCEIMCLGKTKNGHPRHPLYLSNTTELELYVP